MIRSLMASRYRKTYERILARIVGGGVAHVDETEVDLKKEKGYVWVLANLKVTSSICTSRAGRRPSCMSCSRTSREC